MLFTRILISKCLSGIPEDRSVCSDDDDDDEDDDDYDDDDDYYYYDYYYDDYYYYYYYDCDCDSDDYDDFLTLQPIENKDLPTDLTSRQNTESMLFQPVYWLNYKFKYSSLHICRPTFMCLKISCSLNLVFDTPFVMVCLLAREAKDPDSSPDTRLCSQCRVYS